MYVTHFALAGRRPRISWAQQLPSTGPARWWRWYSQTSGPSHSVYTTCPSILTQACSRAIFLVFARSSECVSSATCSIQQGCFQSQGLTRWSLWTQPQPASPWAILALFKYHFHFIFSWKAVWSQIHEASAFTVEINCKINFFPNDFAFKT